MGTQTRVLPSGGSSKGKLLPTPGGSSGRRSLPVFRAHKTGSSAVAGPTPAGRAGGRGRKLPVVGEAKQTTDSFAVTVTTTPVTPPRRTSSLPSGAGNNTPRRRLPSSIIIPVCIAVLLPRPLFFFTTPLKHRHRLNSELGEKPNVCANMCAEKGVHGVDHRLRLPLWVQLP